MKILHVITGLENGGAEGVLYRLITRDRESEHQVVSLSGMGIYGPRLVEAGIVVHALCMPRGRVSVRGVASLAGLIRSFDPDIVQTWMYHADVFGGVTARLMGRRAIVWGVRASNLHAYKKNRSLKRVMWVAARISSVVPAAIVFVSESGAREHHAHGFDETKSVIINNGFEVDKLRPDDDARQRLRAAWGVSPQTRVIGMVARWDPLKDHRTLLAALVQVSHKSDVPWRCVLVGPGVTTANEALVAMVRHYDLEAQVQLSGPKTDICAVMNAIDIHVLSSISEGFPNVVGEALACGTPSIVTDVGDASSIVGDAGWVVPRSDPGALAEAIVAALCETKDVSKWSARRDAGRRRIETRFSMQRMLSRYRDVWQRVREH